MKRILSIVMAVMVMTLGLSSCNCYTKMMKKAAAGITVNCTPEYVTLVGDNAVADVAVTFPAKAFHKYGVLKLTPVLESQIVEGKSVAGEPTILQGEKVSDNYTVVSSVNGGTVTVPVKIAYDKDLRLSRLVFKAEAKCVKQGKKIKEFTSFPKDIFVAWGVNALQADLVDNFAKLAIAPDAFKRVTEINKDAKVNFLVNSLNVRTAQLNSDEIAALEQFIVDNSGDPKKTVGNVEAYGYASPEGPVNFNDNLAKNRGINTQKAVAKKYKGQKLGTSEYDQNAMGEDWDGFKELVAQSDIADKDLILKVLSMYSDPQVRDSEIRNMSATFTVLKEKILPVLRRTKLNVNVQIQGKTDDELKACVANDINSLNVEEMLFAATLYKDNATKAKCYKAAAEKYNDARAWNNLGVVKALDGKVAAGKADVEKAAKIDANCPQIINNLGCFALNEGKKDEAAKYFAAANCPEAKYNKGLVAFAKGDYKAAASSLDGFNKALCNYLSNDVAAAKQGVAGLDCWRADYLKAVIAAKEGNKDALVANLKNAIAKNPEAAALAKTEVAFVPYNGDGDFTAAVK